MVANSDAPVDPQGALERFLGGLRPEARAAFLGVRALVVTLGADVHETPLQDRVAYARERTFLEARCVRGRLLLVFPAGDKLEDPLGRLLRKGPERFLPLDEAEVDGHLQGFVRHAYADARTPV